MDTHKYHILSVTGTGISKIQPHYHLWQCEHRKRGSKNIAHQVKTIQNLIMSELIMCAKNEIKHHQMEIDIESKK